MPYSAPHPCSHPGCPAVVRSGRFCLEHAKQEQGAYDQERGSAAQRGYGARWRKLRAMKLGADPICSDPYHQHPGQVVAATEVDHILPKARGGTDAWENLQSLCGSCHSHKTATQDGGWGREVPISAAPSIETVRGVSDTHPQLPTQGDL